MIKTTMKKTYVKPNTNMTAIQSAQLIMASGKVATPIDQDQDDALQTFEEKYATDFIGGTSSSSDPTDDEDWDSWK